MEGLSGEDGEDDCEAEGYGVMGNYKRTLSDGTVIEVMLAGEEVFIIQEGTLDATSFPISLWEEYRDAIDEGIRSCDVTTGEATV